MSKLRARAIRAVDALLARGNLMVVKARPADIDPEFWPIHDQVRHATMTSTQRMYALWDALRYLHRNGIGGDVVECGVWKGGSAMLAALTLQQLGDAERTLHLYDTFDGMSEPTAVDGAAAHDVYRAGHDDIAFAYAPLDEVRDNVASTGWSSDRVRFVPGKVEDTLPASMPDKIALLRLDTDWYESTRHELVHLYPQLVPGGVLIIDDYGYWQGARRAVDEWLAEVADPPYLARVDWTGRVGVKSA